MNWGANDLSVALPSQASWQNNYIAMIDLVHAKWPNARIWITRPWRRNKDADSATLHTWIDNVVAARSAYTFVGDDEAVWLKGSDDGATNTSDGVHYSVPAGLIAKSAASKAAMGY